MNNPAKGNRRTDKTALRRPVDRPRHTINVSAVVALVRLFAGWPPRRRNSAQLKELG